MPIKLPKGFPRRKSSGTALEELQNPPEPSFRVLERPGSKSFDGGETLKRMSQGRPLSAGHRLDDSNFVSRPIDPNPHNRGSGGTNNSSSSGGHNDNSSASARFSSSSTLPSSTDTPLDDKPLPGQRGSHDIPIPAVPESQSLSSRAKGRAFSFGRKKAETAPTYPPPPRHAAVPTSTPEYTHVTRERALTESSYASGSTATPPKLLDGDLDFGHSDDAFGDMFESFGKRNQLGGEKGGLELPSTMSPEDMSPVGSRNLTKSYFGERSPYTPPPISTDRSRQVETSPYSWGSRDSQDGLMSRSPTAVDAGIEYNGNTIIPRHTSGLTNSRTMPPSESAGPINRTRQQRPPSTTGAGLRRSSAYASPRRESAPFQDEDATLAMESISASQKLDRGSAEQLPSRGDRGDFGNRQQESMPLFGGNDLDVPSSNRRMESIDTTPRAKKLNPVEQEERSLFDVSPPISARMLDHPRQSDQPTTKPGPPKKVMTPAQFERYRREQEMTRSRSSASKSEASDDGDNYDDEDDMEQNKQLIRQRRKQEAHLAVYRQQMMKMTGEQPSVLPDNGLPRPGMARASMSTPNLTIPAVKGSDDEDEDVPLGILAAHGFPAKNRPPTAGNMGTGPIRYTSESYPPPSMSTAGASTAGGPRGLPPFAKHLPPDPYYGAGLVNSANRESLRPANGSVYGSSPSGLHPGGLVGVIAGEERAKALRRGSPNAQGGFSSPLPQGMPHMSMMGMPPGMPPMMTPGDEAQVQMSQQMTQMMQMQMQWMQQMQQMVAGGIPGQQPGQQPSQLPHLPLIPQQQMFDNGFLAPPGGIVRPVSHSAPASPGVVQQNQQRAMSMMHPTSQWPSPAQRASGVGSMMNGAFGGGQGYAPSIAPSERSNIGMPNRYRPVSIAPIDEAPRPSSRTSTMMQMGGGDRKSGASSTLRVVQQPKKVSSDDDDEEGWMEMTKKRETKKNTWKSKKREIQGLQDLYYPEA